MARRKRKTARRSTRRRSPLARPWKIRCAQHARAKGRVWGSYVTRKEAAEAFPGMTSHTWFHCKITKG